MLIVSSKSLEKPKMYVSFVCKIFKNLLIYYYLWALYFSSLFFFLKTFNDCNYLQSEDQKYEYNELLLYQCAILMQSGKYKQALEHLQNNKDFIMDDLSLQENLGFFFVVYL